MALSLKRKNGILNHMVKQLHVIHNKPAMSDKMTVLIVTDFTIMGDPHILALIVFLERLVDLTLQQITK